jgi:molybdopterin converting factor small subunit
MPILYSKYFSTLQELLHEEDVLFREATRMHASAHVLKSLKQQIEKHKAELTEKENYSVNNTDIKQSDCQLLAV